MYRCVLSAEFYTIKLNWTEFHSYWRMFSLTLTIALTTWRAYCLRCFTNTCKHTSKP